MAPRAATSSAGAQTAPAKGHTGRVAAGPPRKGIVKLLLTSAGIKNTSIHNALVDLLGKPIAESSALCIPTAIYPFPGGPLMAYRFISGSTSNPMCGLGWKSLGVLELTALPSIKKEYWIAAVQEADALLVWECRPTGLTMRPPYKWSPAPSKSSPRATGSCLPRKHRQNLFDASVHYPLPNSGTEHVWRLRADVSSGRAVLQA